MENLATIEELPLSRGVTVITSNDDGLVALDKPVGVLSHPNSNQDKMRSLMNAAYYFDDEVFKWKDEAGVEKQAWLVNRLDSGTSGVILLALNPDIAKTVKSCFSTHKVQKTYYALVRGTIAGKVGKWSDQIPKDVRNGAQVIKKARMISATTRFQALKSPTGGFPITLVKLMPITGRTHQLRVQCRKHGNPIVGDRTYGSFSFNREIVHETAQRRMMLHSYETVFRYAHKGKLRDFRAVSEIPEPFDIVMAFRPGLSRGQAEERASKKPFPDSDADSKSEILSERRFKA
ncbi:MAG: RluA family pseudouridine synthase [Opitutaceae bacterium]